jgi:hypothetical protein
MSRARVRSLSTALRPYPFEVVALGAALVTIVFLRLRGLHYGWNTVEFLFPPLLRGLPRFFVVGVTLRAAQRLVSGGSVRDYLRTVFRRRWLLLFLRCWLASLFLVYGYTWLKVSIPLLRTSLFDPQLWQLDRLIHFGVSPSVLAIGLTAGTPLAPFLDRYYGLWVPTLPILMGFFFALDRDDLRRNFALAAAVLWSAGAWIYFAVPVLGPCFASPDLLDPIRDQLPRAVATQRALWDHYLMMVRGRSGGLTGFQPMYGVAALPSLHVGAHALLAFWARRHERWLFVPAAVVTALTLFASVVTGWHYAIDGYAGILLAWLAVRLADRFDPVERPAAGGAPLEASGSIAP